MYLSRAASCSNRARKPAIGRRGVEESISIVCRSAKSRNVLYVYILANALLIFFFVTRVHDVRIVSRVPFAKHAARPIASKFRAGSTCRFVFRPTFCSLVSYPLSHDTACPFSPLLPPAPSLFSPSLIFYSPARVRDTTAVHAHVARAQKAAVAPTKSRACDLR